MVRVILSAPDGEALDPTPDERLAELTLVASSPGTPVEVARRRVAGERRLSFGEIAARPGIRLSVLATAASGRLLGFGRSAAPVDVKAGDDLEITVELRRPFAYIGGGPNLLVADTTLDSPAYQGQVALAGPVAAAPFPDGSHVLVAAGDVLRLVSTFTHVPVEQASPPALAGVTDLAVSPDGRHAVALTAEGAAVIDLVALRAGQAVTPVMVPIPGAARVAIGAQVAYVLAGVDPVRCDVMSRIVRIPLDAPAAMPDVALGMPVLDLAVDPATEELYVPLPCQGRVNRVRIVGDAAEMETVLMVPTPGSVAVGEGRIWAVGAEPIGNGQRLVIASVGTDGTGSTRVDMPVTEERATSTELDEPGHSAEMRLEADELYPTSLTVLPDGRQVALLVRAKFHAAKTIEPVEVLPGVFVDEVILPEMDIDTSEYLLIDTAAVTLVHRLRTRCDLTWLMGEAFIDIWACGRAPGQDVVADPFTPRGLAVLYGER